MSAVGKLDIHGDFDENGQLVETPYRANLASRRAPAPTPVPVAAQVRVPVAAAQDLVRPVPLPPNPAPLSRKPIPSDLVLDRSRDQLLTAFGKATLTDR